MAVVMSPARSAFVEPAPTRARYEMLPRGLVSITIRVWEVKCAGGAIEGLAISNRQLSIRADSLRRV